MIVGILLFLIMTFIPIDHHIKSVLYFVVGIAVALFITKGKLNLLFKKPKLADIKTILISVIAYFVLNGLIHNIVSLIPHHQDAGVNVALTNIPLLVVTALQIFGEEVFRFMPFILVAYFVYKSTQNRKHAVLLGAVASLIIFGALHTSAYGSFLFAVVGITIPAIALAYSYLKTKNIFVSYLVHLIIDFSLIMLFNLAPLVHVAT
ncbi:type II CAAX prenyl endopeptidase Rce1 family protein [uncultured Methanobrevibacter sp.]|uniref:CPBP family glutamic-type intramembrane protease n=1 Tax=uncultured Methanobrevibacter sp. TaxID=253161 RepID=UPI0025D5195D|nr:CPBP family glutamic-type intramembrane protease [uncultured Methanobrevibacter sp.]